LLKIDEVNDAIHRRMRVILFNSKFITEDKYDEEETGEN
jgi:hypothetical protein